MVNREGLKAKFIASVEHWGQEYKESVPHGEQAHHFHSFLNKWAQTESAGWARCSPCSHEGAGAWQSLCACTLWEGNKLPDISCSKTFTGENKIIFRGFQTEEKKIWKIQISEVVRAGDWCKYSTAWSAEIPSPSAAADNAAHYPLSMQFPHHFGSCLVQAHLTTKSHSLSHPDGCRAEKEKHFQDQKVSLNGFWKDGDWALRLQGSHSLSQSWFCTSQPWSSHPSQSLDKTTALDLWGGGNAIQKREIFIESKCERAPPDSDNNQNSLQIK